MQQNNISTVLASILGNYSIKATEFLHRFVELFNIHTNYQYQEKFINYLFFNDDRLSTLNFIIPVRIKLTLVDKFNYTYEIDELLLPLIKTIFKVCLKKKKYFLFIFYKLFWYYFFNSYINLQTNNFIKKYQIFRFSFSSTYKSNLFNN
jgi:hypothetical protein